MKEVVKLTCRELRKRQTPQERLFWETVRNRQFNNYKFIRQHPIVFKYEGKERFFIADFYCADKKLVIELDGSVHDYQQEYDTLRDYIISILGIRVVRIKNSEIQTKNVTHECLLRIFSELDSPLFKEAE